MKKPPQGGLATVFHMTTTQTLRWAADSILGGFMMLLQHGCDAEDSGEN